MNEIDARHHRDLWKLVNRLRQMRFHFTCLAGRCRQEVGVWHRATVQEIYMEIDLFMCRYHRGVRLPPVTIERDPGYAEVLQDYIIDHMLLQEEDLFEQMLGLLHLMHDELWFRQPKKGSDAATIVTWLLCEQINELLTYLDIGVLDKVRETGELQLRCSADTDAGRLLQARLSKDGTGGELFLWDKFAGSWQYTGLSVGTLLISVKGLPDGITQLPHWSELRPHVLLESSAFDSPEVLR
jgi:hypothetical protein